MLAAMIFVARVLGKEAYGELGMIQSTISMLGVLAGFGLGLTATKHVAEMRKSDPEKAGRILVLSGVIAIASGALMASVLFLLAPWLAEKTIAAPHLTNHLRIGALILFISALNGAQNGALSGFEAFRAIAGVNFATGIASFPIILAGAYWGGLVGIVWALAASMGLGLFLGHIALRREAARAGLPLTLQGIQNEWHVLWRFTIPAALSGILVVPVNWVCAAFLVNGPGGYPEMGIFNAANQIFSFLILLPLVLGRVLLPVLANEWNDNRPLAMKLLMLAVKTNLYVLTPLIILGCVLSPYIMALYGESFESGWPTLVIVLVTAGFVAANVPMGHILAASSQMWIGFAMNAGWAIVFVIGTILLVRYGSIGVASARAIAYVIHTGWVFAFANRLKKAYQVVPV